MLRACVILCTIFLSKYFLLFGLLYGRHKFKIKPIIALVMVSGVLISLILGEIKTAAFYAFGLFTTLANIDRMSKLTTTNFTAVRNSFILLIIIILVSYYKDGHLIFGIDKNTFCIPVVFLLIYITNYRRLDWIEVVLLVYLSMIINSTNFQIYVILCVISQEIKLKQRGGQVAAFLMAQILSISYVLIAAVYYDFNNPTSWLFPASIIERGVALQTYAYFIADHGLPLWSGNFEHYSLIASTYVHHDLLKLVLQHGLIYTIIVTILQLYFMKKMYLKFSNVFAIYLFSGLLGGMGWFGGHIIILLFMLLNLFEKRDRESLQ